MRSRFRKSWDQLDLLIESSFRKVNCRRKAKKRLKRMNGGFACDKEYRELVVPYWKKYGYKPKKYWYSMFSDYEKKVDPRYIPDDLYYGEMIPYFSNSQFRRFGEDKCYHDVWFPDLKRPETICKNIAGVYYDPVMCPIPEEAALDLVMKYHDSYLIKPSIDSGEGRLIRFFEPESTSRSEVKEAFHAIKSNFIVQAQVRQHPILASLNPSSLNTIRVVSFFFEGEVHILSCILRIGAENAKVDNVGAGGYACPVLMNGQLNDKAVNRKAEWVEDNGKGISFRDVQVPEFEKILDAVQSAHKRMAHFKLIGWDMSVDNEGDPVMIEFNTCPGSNQISCGPTFGDLTDRVLDEFFLKRSLRNAQN